jgi:hypothetical protein
MYKERRSAARGKVQRREKFCRWLGDVQSRWPILAERSQPGLTGRGNLAVLSWLGNRLRFDGLSLHQDSA